MARYALTILLSAFLLFQVQPLIAKRILPWFGGGPAVWTTCMLFFQVLLLIGYAYAHLLSSLSGRKQWIIHSILLIAAACTLPIEPSTDWKPTGSDAPSLRILLLLTFTVGLPYGLLSTTGPLVQRWFSATHPGRSPYRLFALSNFGSLVALLSYPFLFEPYFTVHTQIVSWSSGFALFALLCASCAWKISSLSFDESRDTAIASEATDGAEHSKPSGRQIAVWIGLAAMPSLMLLATTNQMCQEVAVVPFLWIVPLSLYLLSFILCFDSERWYSRPVFALMLFGSAGLAVACLMRGTAVALPLQIFIYSLTLFVCCMTCHGELAKSRPDSSYLTLFYLAISIGGALGGVFVVVVAPNIFVQFWEYHFALGGCILMTLVGWFRARDWVLYQARPTWAWVGLVAIFGVITAGLIVQAREHDGAILNRSRNFYGVLTVLQRHDRLGDYYTLHHGRISHGFQYLEGEQRLWPVSYYGRESGVGLAIRFHPARISATPRPMHVGVIGLGAGTLATYADPGDRIRFYDINPDVESAARSYFSYLESCRGEEQVILGDARVMLEHELEDEGSQQFDVLAVDAFSSDAIPMHLLTRECFELYWQHLAEDGLLAIHISNRYIALEPVVKTLAESAGYHAALIEFDPWGESDEAESVSACTWILVARSPEFFEIDEMEGYVTDWEDGQIEIEWTDDFGSLWPVLKHKDMLENFGELFDF